MRQIKLFSVGFVSVVVVLAAVSGVVFTATPSADVNAQMQQNGQDAEPNDSRQNATAIETNQIGFSEGLLKHTIENDTVTEEDVDFYEFNASAGQAINVYLRSAIPSVEATLYDPSGEVIANETSAADATTMGGVAEENGTYYLRIRGNQPVRAGESGTYQFGVDTANQDSFEPNDDRSAASAIESGEHVNGTIAKGDADVFAIEADAGETITASAVLRNTKVINQGNIAIDILNAEGDRLNEVANDTSYPPFGDNVTNVNGAQGSAPDNESVSATVEEAGTYYIRVKESPEGNDFTDIGGFIMYGLDVNTSGADQPTDTPTETVTPTETPETTSTETETSQSTTDTPTETETPQPTTDTPTETPSETETPDDTQTETTTETARETTESSTDQSDEQATEQPTERQSTESDTSYYQVDFVVGEPIENLRGPNGTYENNQLIRFAHGSTEEPIMRLSDGEFITDEDMAERIESRDIEVENGTAMVTFTVTEGETVELSLVSYTKPGPGWSPEIEHLQEFVDAETQTFESGTHTLTVELPGEEADGHESN